MRGDTEECSDGKEEEERKENVSGTAPASARDNQTSFPPSR
jgi:hypothetical protein